MSGIVVGAAVLLALTLAPGIFVRSLSVARMRRLSRGKLVLTYDDGPSPVSPTPQILELLRTHGARATFFVLGRRTHQSAGMCDRLAAEGHDIGAHGYAHRHGWKDPIRAVTDLVHGVKSVAGWRRGPPLYRPPYGKSTLWTLLAARSCGARTVWWTLDSRDWWPTPPDIENVVAQVEREHGGVVLMHDFERSPESKGVQYTLALTDRLLRLAAQRRWTVCTVTELLGEARGGDGHAQRWSAHGSGARAADS